MSKWAEIRVTDYDENCHCWLVDAWETDNDAEEGKVIAFIHDVTCDVIYVDPVARVDEYAQEEINAKLAELKKYVSICREQGQINVYYKTPVGTLVAEFEEPEITGTDYNAIFVGLKPACDPEGSYVDLVSARVYENEGKPCEKLIKLNAWEDPSREDPTYEGLIFDDAIKDAILIEEGAGNE